MTQAQINTAIADAVAAALAKANGASKPKRSKADMLSAKDKQIRAGFTRKGIKDVVLMDRNDPSKDFNVRPFGKPAKDDQPATGWLALGRVVKRGEHGVRGLFHISQTEPLSE